MYRNGGKLPKALYKFNHNNVLEGFPFNKEAEGKLIKLAVKRLGDKAQFIGHNTLTANLVLACTYWIAVYFPVKGHRSGKNCQAHLNKKGKIQRSKLKYHEDLSYIYRPPAHAVRLRDLEVCPSFR